MLVTREKLVGLASMMLSRHALPQDSTALTVELNTPYHMNPSVHLCDAYGCTSCEQCLIGEADTRLRM